MSSNIPTRRPTRAIRPIQGDENKIVKGTTIPGKLARTKVAVGGSGSSTTGKEKAIEKGASGSGATDIHGKRKRDALGEVTNGKGTKSVLTEKKVPINRDTAGSASSKGLVKKTTKTSHLRKGSTASDVDVNTETSTQDRSQVSNTSTVTVTRQTRRVVHKPYVYGAPADEEPVNKKRRTSPEIPSEAEKVVEVTETEEVKLEVIKEEEPAFDVAEAAKAGVDVKGWVDIDKDDWDDPNMVSEYVGEIFEYLMKQEQKTLPDPNYMELVQNDLAWNMRGILVDFIVQIHGRFRMQQETLFLTTNIMDRFLSARECAMSKFQLVGCAAFFIASKCEETIAPSYQHLVQASEGAFTDAELLTAERYILKTLNWDLSYPNPLNFLRRASKADDYDVHNRTLGKFLIEIGVMEWRLVACPPSLLAAAAMWIARLILGNDEWTPTLEHYTTYGEQDLLPTASIMINYLLKPVKHQNFYKKYASKKFMKASLYCRTWALERWQPNERVDLSEELPFLKQHARRPIQLHNYQAQLEALQRQQ